MWRHSLSHMEKAVMVSLPSGMLSQGFLVHILETFLQICLSQGAKCYHFLRYCLRKNDVSGFDLIKAQRMYAPESKATENRQTAEWNRALKKSRDAGWGNVIEAECLQLMTRDICMSTISLLTMTGKVLVVLMIVYMSVWNPIKMLAIPLAYLVAMLFVSRTAAMKRADRLVTIVIKNDVQMQGCDSG